MSECAGVERLDGRFIDTTNLFSCNAASYRFRPFLRIDRILHNPFQYRLAPSALSDDGKLDLVLFHGKTRAATLAFALALVAGRHVRRKDLRIVPVEGEIRLKLPEGTCAQIDGDAFGGCRELTLSIAKEKLSVLAP